MINPAYAKWATGFVNYHTTWCAGGKDLKFATREAAETYFATTAGKVADCVGNASYDKWMTYDRCTEIVSDKVEAIGV